MASNVTSTAKIATTSGAMRGIVSLFPMGRNCFAQCCTITILNRVFLISLLCLYCLYYYSEWCFWVIQHRNLWVISTWLDPHNDLLAPFSTLWKKVGLRCLNLCCKRETTELLRISHWWQALMSLIVKDIISNSRVRVLVSYVQGDVHAQIIAQML